MYAPIYQSIRRFSTGNVSLTLCWPSSQYGPQRIHRSEMMNGIKIAAAKTMGHPMAACTIMFQAGSRHETHDDLGACHFLRLMSASTGMGYTAFAKIRVLQQIGAHLTCTSNRQYTAYTLCCPSPLFADIKYYLLDTAARGCYNEWDVTDTKPHIRDELLTLTSEQRVLDLVQKAAFSGPLSNSIYCEEERIKEMSRLKICGYVYNNFKSSVCSVASVGIPFEETMKIAEKIDTQRIRPEGPEQISSYPKNGYEFYDTGKCSETWVAAVVPGCGSESHLNMLKHAIIAEACGSGNIQEGQHDTDRMSQDPIGNMSVDMFTNYKAFNLSYLDCGLFGVMGKSLASTARATASSVVEFLSHVGDLNFQQMDLGKRRLKLALLQQNEDCASSCESLACQLASNLQVDNIEELLSMIDCISPAELTCAAKCLTHKKCDMAIAIVGDMGAVPHDKELLKNN